MLKINIEDIVSDLETTYPELEVTVEEKDKFNKITVSHESGSKMFFYPELVNEAKIKYNFNMFANEEEYINYIKNEVKQFFYGEGYTY